MQLERSLQEKGKRIVIDHLSYSSISTYLLCPRSWRYRYIDKVEAPVSPALVFGSAFHDALETYIKNRETPLAHHWTHAWSSQLEQRETISWDKEPYTYEDLGTAMFSNADTVSVIDAIQPLRVNDYPVIEERVELKVPGVPVPVIGFVDIIEEDGVPGDFKTSARSWTQKRANDELQPTFYLAALNQLGFELNPDLMFRYYVFVKNAKKPQLQIWETQRTAADMFWMFGTVREVWQGIERHVFPPNPTTWKCSPKWCEYWDGCRG